MAGIKSAVWPTGAFNLLAVLVLYFALPLRSADSPVRLAIDVLLALAGLVGIGWLITQQVKGELGGQQKELRVVHLVLLFELALVIFSLVYYAMAVHGSHQMEGVHTKIDALYFTASTMATVGYGDVTATGQAARAVVTINLAFDVVFLAALAQLATKRLRRR